MASLHPDTSDVNTPDTFDFAIRDDYRCHRCGCTDTPRCFRVVLGSAVTAIWGQCRRCDTFDPVDWHRTTDRPRGLVSITMEGIK